MSIKIIGVILGLLAIGSIGFFGLSNYQKTNQIPFDFGDAPDGKASGYFPSLFKSDGARARKTDMIWLGKAVTMENDSKQVNLDEADDGVKLDLNPCKISKAYFFVHLKDLGKTGTAYLNLYADWNKDGKWQGSDECASEWTVKNFPIDLSRQNQEIAVYVQEFTAGKNTKDFWYRGIVSLNQQMNERATGEFERGEVEDYNSEEPDDEKYYGAYCDPDPLKIKHGEKGDIKILPVLFSEPIKSVELGQNVGPVNDKRKVSVQNNVVTYESSQKDVDGPKRSDNHNVGLKVSFGAGSTEAVLKGFCVVVVDHDEITIKTPSEKNPPRRSFPSKTIETGHPTLTPVENSPALLQSELHIQEKASGLTE